MCFIKFNLVSRSIFFFDVINFAQSASSNGNNVKEKPYTPFLRFHWDPETLTQLSAMKHIYIAFLMVKGTHVYDETFSSSLNKYRVFLTSCVRTSIQLLTYLIYFSLRMKCFRGQSNHIIMLVEN